MIGIIMYHGRALKSHSGLRVKLGLTLFTLLVSHSEYQRDKPFLLTMVSYLKK